MPRPSRTLAWVSQSRYSILCARFPGLVRINLRSEASEPRDPGGESGSKVRTSREASIVTRHSMSLGRPVRRVDPRSVLGVPLAPRISRSRSPETVRTVGIPEDQVLLEV